VTAKQSWRKTNNTLGYSEQSTTKKSIYGQRTGLSSEGLAPSWTRTRNCFTPPLIALLSFVAFENKRCTDRRFKEGIQYAA
jgi:hypothetical protein